MKNKVLHTAQTITELTEITTSCFYKGKLIGMFANIDYPKIAEPLFLPYLETMDQIKEPVGYIKTPHSLMFGIVNLSPYHLVLGPLLTDEVKPRDFAEIVHNITQNKDISDFVLDFLSECKRVTPSALIPLLTTTISLFALGKKSGTADVSTGNYVLSSGFSYIDQKESPDELQKIPILEYFTNLISEGDVDAVREWFEFSPSIKFCPDVGGSSLRNAKNSFLISSTIAIQSAMSGGMDVTYALEQHQKYIRKSETSTSADEVMKLQITFFIEIADKMHELKGRNIKSSLVSDAIAYINRNLYSNLRVQSIAEALYVSRAHLSKAFHSEMGMTLSSYITEQKVEEAKKLLKYTRKPISIISTDLSFSSQSYFSKVFKEQSGLSPNEYRNSN
jgi:AraC-like DNA-binding protein